MQNNLENSVGLFGKPFLDVDSSVQNLFFPHESPVFLSQKNQYMHKGPSFQVALSASKKITTHKSAVPRYITVNKKSPIHCSYQAMKQKISTVKLDCTQTLTSSLILISRNWGSSIWNPPITLETAKAISLLYLQTRITINFH